MNFAWTPLCGRFFSYLLLLPPKRHSVYGSLQIDHLEFSEEDRLPPSPHRKALQRLRSLSCSLCCCCCVVEDQEMDNHRFVYWSNFYDSKILWLENFPDSKIFWRKNSLKSSHASPPKKDLFEIFRGFSRIRKFDAKLPKMRFSKTLCHKPHNFTSCLQGKPTSSVILLPAFKVRQGLQW